jgi:hypothetical protein
MPCIMAVLALAAPRVAIVLLWLFTTWFRGVFPVIIWPLLGFLFMPMTMLWYSAVFHWYGMHWTFWPVFGMVLAVLWDLSPALYRHRRREVIVIHDRTGGSP